MKKRNTKKGEFICRRQKPSDKSFSLKKSYLLAYFETMDRPACIVRKRKINNVIYVGRDENFKSELKELLHKYNAKACIYCSGFDWEEDTIVFEEKNSGDTLFEFDGDEFSASNIFIK